MPVRLQRRSDGNWKAPPAAVYVGRPTNWGNPFTHLKKPTLATITVATLQASVDFYEAMVTGDPEDILGQCFDIPEQEEFIRKRGLWIGTHVHELAGKDLICWCPLTDLCHAELLLKWANDEEL